MMDKYFLLTYVKKGTQLDLVNKINLDKIEIAAIDLEYFKNLEKNAEEDNIQVIGVEAYSVLNFKLKVIEDFIRENCIFGKKSAKR